MRVDRASDAAAYRREYGARGAAFADEAARVNLARARRRRRVRRAWRRARAVAARVRRAVRWWRGEERTRQASDDL